MEWQSHVDIDSKMWFQFSWSRENVVIDGFRSKIRIYIRTKDIVDKSNVGEHLHNDTLAILHASTEATQGKASASWVVAENERLGGLCKHLSLTSQPPQIGDEIVSHHFPFSDEGRGFLPDPFRTEKQTVRPLSTVVNETPGSGSHNSPCSYPAPSILVCGTRSTGSWRLWLIFFSLSR